MSVNQQSWQFQQQMERLMDAMTSHAFPKQTYDEPMASIDHAWLRMDNPVGPMVINSVITFKSSLPYAEFIKRMLEQFTTIPRFRCSVVSSTLGDHWRETDIERDYHFPTYEKQVASNDELQNIATDFINEPLDMKKPLWRMLYIHKYKKGTAIVVRIHHAYADGMALVKVLMQLMDEGPLIKKITNSSQKPPPKDVSSSNWLNRFQPFLPGNGKWAETLKLVEELSTELVKMSLSRGEENVFKTPGLCGKKQLVWTEPLNLNEVKTIAKTHQAKVNDILLSSAAGAFRRYLKELNQLSAWSELRTLIPVDLRANIKAKELGNYFGLVFLSLPLGIEDPIERANELHMRMDALKKSKQAWLVFQILQLSGHLPEIAEKELVRLFSSKASAVMTNVPGPPFPLHLAGRELEQILFWVPQSGSIGTGVSIITYNKKVQFGLMTDKQLISKPEQIINCFNHEFESLLLQTLMTVKWPT